MVDQSSGYIEPVQNQSLDMLKDIQLLQFAENILHGGGVVSALS